MAIHEPYTAVDGYSGFSACHTALAPLQLGNTMFSKGINLTVRGGLVSTRPGFESLGKLGEGEFQGAAVYSLDAVDHVGFAISGRVYVRSSDGVVHPIGGTLNATGPVYFTQVYRWLVCQDGASRPIVVEESGGVFSRLERDVGELPANNWEDEPYEPPLSYDPPGRDPGYSGAPRICLVPGTVGAYAHGRYHYVPTKVPLQLPEVNVKDGKYLNNVEDLVPLPSEETGRASVISTDVLDSLDPYTVFRLSEHRVLAEGGALALPAELGFIHGMGSLRGAATGTGVGSLFVFGSRGVAAFEFGAPRAEWKVSSLSQVVFTGPGTLSPRSVMNINDDVWYISTEGHLRSINYDGSQLSSRGNAAPALFNVTKSLEAKRWVDQTSREWLPKASACLADNRIHWVLADGRALGSIELAQAYDANPAELPILHEGIWTGFDFQQVLSLDNRLHVVVKENESLFLLRLGSKDGYDPGGTPIKSELVTRSFSYIYNEASTYRELKRLIDLKLFFQDIDRPTAVTAEYRPQHMLRWTPLGSALYNVPPGSGGQFRRLVLAPDMTQLEICNPVTKDPPWMFHAMQFRLQWTGRLTIARLSTLASQQEEATQPACADDNPEGVSLPLEADDDFTYTVEIGD